MAENAAGETQGWGIVHSRIIRLSLSKEQKRAAWVLLNSQNLPLAERLTRVEPEDDADELASVLRCHLLFAGQAVPLAAVGGPLVAAAAAAGAAAAAAAAAATGPAQNAAGPTYRALDILHFEHDPWSIGDCNNTTVQREYDDLELTTWDIDDDTTDQIQSYLHRKLENTVLAQNPRIPRLQQLVPLESESECNSQFDLYYGQPVAHVLTECCNSTVSFHHNTQTMPATGCPNFFFRLNGVELLRGEGKTPSVMKKAETMFPPHEDAKLNACARQICDYMLKTERRYGWITYLNGTFFIKRSSTKPHLYHFTRALPSASVDITVSEMLAYIAFKQMEEVRWQAVPAHQSAIGVQQGPDSQNDQNQSNYTGPMTRSRAAANQQPVQDMASSSGALHSHPNWALQISGKQLGVGHFGIVIEGGYYGEPAAIKAMDLSKQYKEVGLFWNEIDTYRHLDSLQGQCIPVLKGYGLWDKGNTMFLAMSVVEGEHPSRNTSGAVNVAMKALRCIHDMGVLHGDIGRENILISKKGEDWQVWFLDFGHSSMSRDSAAQAFELRQLMALFRCSSDAGGSGLVS